MANSFLCHIEENLDQANKVPSLYKRYVDDTLAFVDNIDDAVLPPCTKRSPPIPGIYYGVSS